MQDKATWCCLSLPDTSAEGDHLKPRATIPTGVGDLVSLILGTFMPDPLKKERHRL